VTKKKTDPGPTHDSSYKLLYIPIGDLLQGFIPGAVYLFLEFQSTTDRWVAVRIQTYLGLL